MELSNAQRAGLPKVDRAPISWLTQLDYQEAIEFPARCFEDSALRTATIMDRTAFGMPLPVTGQFTNVYRMRLAMGEVIAVRLFLREGRGRARHWKALRSHLESLPVLPHCLAQVEYQEEGFLFRGQRYPLVRMPWLPGCPLNAYIEKNLYDALRLKRLAENWQRVIGELEMVRFIHGDLQHGNVLVEEGTETISFVDYDASYVPELTGVANRESGHPSYQHPRRTPADYGPFMDRFAALAIYAAIRTLIVAPDLWFRLDNGDNLLFQREDFETPGESRAFSLLQEKLRHYHSERNLILSLQAACSAPPKDAPSLDRI